MCFNRSPFWTQHITPTSPALTLSGTSSLSTRHALRNTSNPLRKRFWRTRWIPMLLVSCEEMVPRPAKVARLSPRRRRRQRASALTGSSTHRGTNRRPPVLRSQVGDPCTLLLAQMMKATSEMGLCGCSLCILLHLSLHLLPRQAADHR